ncbi:zinc ABC transporter permease [Pelistega indica]|uniref:Zinc ABC transporter permease n=1 Tax=Pelistega indica TaxID=1414851 RepID=V8FYY5_9BURK|nr:MULTISPECIES: metal ABC transporter permease [Pelistega]ETD68923.1 zinc ABC transporter permease [Pelistega indica]
MYEIFLAPFVDFSFMARGLFGGVFLALSTSSLGVFLVLRRMSLVADSMSHAILPGVALGFLFAGMSMMAMFIGGLVTGLIVAIAAGVIARLTMLKEDTSFAALYLISLGLGVVIVSARGTNMDLLHVLFGSVLTLDDTALLLIMIISSVSLLVLALVYRPLIMDCLDPTFFKVDGGKGKTHIVFLLLLVMNLLSGFQVLGTLMVVGMMLLPAIAAKFIGRTLEQQIFTSVLIGICSVYVGMVISFHISLPTSACIILTAGIIYLLALSFGPQGGLLKHKLNRRK